MLRLRDAGRTAASASCPAIEELRFSSGFLPAGGGHASPQDAPASTSEKHPILVYSHGQGGWMLLFGHI